ncbi:ubiquitin carboxyl-terminal hydrolase L5 [Exophiala viscosa]|uniref:ubiquitin carboxyl-terminal hydrolase L5 n=1 Tax=Exophiala viscosa TaxID=2486360 RepID=UPI00219051D9|nr:ubiquitin carboxyl-terminal hydrolase L5 [Exophiala viscosa]
MPRSAVTLANKRALELYESNMKCANNHSETEETAPESNTAATSTSEDTTQTNGSPTANRQIGSWAGWAELENDPEVFTTLLREWGVPGVQVNEVVPLDSVFDHPAESIFGLIFLSRWMPAETDNDITKPPAGVWFANQTLPFSCATVALLNIMNNHSGIDLGPPLNEFRENTLKMTPKERGIALDAFDHVRDVHNSFATEIDKLNIDLRLKQEFAAAEKEKKAKAAQSKRPRKKNKKQTKQYEEDENGFHFVAYVPVDGCVWKMDGLEQLPRKLGALADGDSWVAMVLPELQAQCETATASAFEFSLLSLTAATDNLGLEANREKMKRVREDWGPFIAQMVRLHAEKGTLRNTLG